MFQASTANKPPERTGIAGRITFCDDSTRGQRDGLGRGSRMFGMKRDGLFGLCTLLGVLGCGNAAMEGTPAGDEDATSPQRGDAAMPANSNDAGDDSPGLDVPDSGAPAPQPSGDGGAMDGAMDVAMDGAIGEPDPVPWPEGSRVVDHVLNLVGSKGVEELETYLTTRGPSVHPVNRQGLLESTNLFLSLYPEGYDFVVFTTDHPVENTTTVGKFQAINQSAQLGTGNSTEVHPPNYRSDGHLRAVLGVQFHERAYPPVSHELLHYYAQDLDRSFGFGESAERHWGPHWGYSDVEGQLGGFDRDTLECVQPDGAAAPGSCEAEASGRTRYRVAAFAPQAGGSRPYAPLELYLMGLLPLSMVPDTILMLQDAEQVADSYDEATQTLVVEASGASELAVAEIVARHGEVTPLSDEERTFKVAYVVLSEAPASDAVMEAVANWAAVFGGRRQIGGIPSFETTTGDLARADTRLGERRSTDDPAPDPRPALECDVLAQDCDNPDRACHQFAPGLCQLAGTLTQGEPCSGNDQCMPGLGCAAAKSDTNVLTCEPYCDAADASADKACQTLCPSTYLFWVDDDNEPIGAVCRAP